MRTPLVLPIFCVLWSGVSSAGVTAPETPQLLDYLYVEPNTGGSSGGHAAVCLAETCYHFQQIDGLIRLRRESREHLDFDYRVLDNRTVHVSRVAVSDEAKTRIGDAFDRRLWAEERHFEVLDGRTQDRLLLEQLRAGRSASSLRFPGSGYFVRDQSGEPSAWWPADAPRAALIEGLAQRIAAAYGNDFLARRATELRSGIAELEPPREEDDPSGVDADRAPRAEHGFAARHRELVSGLLAVEILRTAPRLDPERTLRLGGAESRLTMEEIEALRRFGTRLAGALVRLAASSRPDWGYPLLIGMARLLAIDESVRSGSLVVLDVFAEDAASIPARKVAAHAETLVLVREDRRADLARLRAAFFAGGKMDEARFSMLELAANLFADIDRGVTEHAAIRVPSESPLPVRSAQRRDWPVPAFSGASLDQALAVARRREAAYRQELERLYPYDLLARNCVTELFRTMETALVDEAHDADVRVLAEASRRALGGYVDWRRELNFIPFVSQHSVRGEYRIAATADRASYRSTALRQMYESENDLRVDLRESNVLTARSYERNDDDSLFLFFTDNVLLRRPLYGAVNLAVGVGGSLAGVALLPFDGGRTIRAGLNGALFSLPELAMVNVRKGSFAFAPRRWSEGIAVEQ